MVREVRPRLLGRSFVSARLSHDDVLHGVTRRTLVAGLKGASVTSVLMR